MKTRDQMLKEMGVGNIYISKIDVSPLFVTSELDNYYNIISKRFILAKDIKSGYKGGGYKYKYHDIEISAAYWIGNNQLQLMLENGISVIIDENEYIEDVS